MVFFHEILIVKDNQKIIIYYHYKVHQNLVMNYTLDIDRELNLLNEFRFDFSVRKIK